jgi:hypothetical protein
LRVTSRGLGDVYKRQALNKLLKTRFLQVNLHPPNS